MTITVTLKLQGKDEVVWKGPITVSARCWNAIRPGWNDVDEYDYDYGWNLLVDAVVNRIPDSIQYEDWYIYDWEV